MRRPLRAGAKGRHVYRRHECTDGIILFGEPVELVPETSDDDKWTNPAKWNKPGTK